MMFSFGQTSYGFPIASRVDAAEMHLWSFSQSGKSKSPPCVVAFNFNRVEPLRSSAGRCRPLRMPRYAHKSCSQCTMSGPCMWMALQECNHELPNKGPAIEFAWQACLAAPGNRMPKMIGVKCARRQKDKMCVRCPCAKH